MLSSIAIWQRIYKKTSEVQRYAYNKKLATSISSYDICTFVRSMDTLTSGHLLLFQFEKLPVMSRPHP